MGDHRSKYHRTSKVNAEESQYHSELLQHPGVRPEWDWGQDYRNTTSVMVRGWAYSGAELLMCILGGPFRSSEGEYWQNRTRDSTARTSRLGQKLMTASARGGGDREKRWVFTGWVRDLRMGWIWVVKKQEGEKTFLFLAYIMRRWGATSLKEEKLI